MNREDINNEELRAKFSCLTEGILAINEEIEEKLRLLEEKQRHHNEMVARVNSNKSAAKSKTSLNVGGQVFTASKETFLQWKGSYFDALLCNDGWSPEEDGTYFIDRDPELFSRIMTSLRAGSFIDPAGLSPAQMEKLRIELDYYQLPSWIIPVPVKWDPTNCDHSLTICEDGHTVTRTSGYGPLWCQVHARPPDLPCFSVCLKRICEDEPNCASVMIGYVCRTGNPDKIKCNGWFLDSTGLLIDPSGVHRSTENLSLKEGDIVTVRLDKTTSTVQYTVNGTRHDASLISTEALTCGKFFPCVRICTVGEAVSILGSPVPSSGSSSGGRAWI